MNKMQRFEWVVEDLLLGIWFIFIKICEKIMWTQIGTMKKNTRYSFLLHRSKFREHMKNDLREMNEKERIVFLTMEK